MAANGAQATKTKVKAKPGSFVRKRKSVKNVLDNVNGIVEVIILMMTSTISGMMTPCWKKLLSSLRWRMKVMMLC